MSMRYMPKDVHEYLELFSKRKGLFFIPFGVVIIALLLIYPFMPRLYESSAVVLIDDDKIIDPLAKGVSREVDFNKKLKTLSAQIQSWSNMVQLIQKLGLMKKISDQKSFENLVLEMRERIDMKMLSDKIIRITFEDEDRTLAYQMTNAVAENLLKINRNKKEDEAQNAIDFIAEQLRVYKDKLQNSERTFFTNRLNDDVNEARKRRELLLEQMSAMENSALKGDIKNQNPVLQQLALELAQSESLYHQMQADAKANNPLIRDLSDKIETLKRRIAVEREGVKSSETRLDSPGYQDLATRMKELDLTLAALEKRKFDLTENKILPGRVSEAEISAMQRDKKVNEDIYQSLLMRLENVQITKRMDAFGHGDSFQILDPARMPLKPTKPNPFRFFGLGALIALAAGAGVVFLREYFDTSFRGVRDAKETIELPLLACIPRITTVQDVKEQRKYELFTAKDPAANGESGSYLRKKLGWVMKDKQAPLYYMADKVRDKKISPSLVPFHDSSSIPAEQYRLLRTSLLFKHHKEPFKTILFTSSIEGEGKSTVSASLAASFALETQHKILLMDCDLRKGAVASLFGVENDKGLSDFLSGHCEIGDILKPTVIKGLDVVASGKLVPNPTALLGNKKMEALMEAIASRYDFIFLDAPPVLSLADVPMLSSYADGMVIVVQAGRTPREQVMNTQTALAQTHKARVIGYVLSRVENYIPSYLYQYVLRQG